MSATLEALRDRYLAAQVSGDRRAAMHVVVEEGLAAGHSIRDLQCAVVQEAQREIGRLWQFNRISIAQEHMATAISHVVLARLFDEATQAESLGHKVLVACVEGERHEFPARLVSDFLELAGFEVRYVGADVPTEHLVRLIDEVQPDLLALSVTMSFNVPGLRAAVAAVRAAHPDLPILAGGHALDWEPAVAGDVGVATCPADAACLVDTARKMARARAPA